MGTVHNDTYKPLSRPLFIYVKGSSFKRREVQAFIDYIFDNEVQIAQRARFIPLTKMQLKRARTNFHLAVAAAKKRLGPPPTDDLTARGGPQGRLLSLVEATNLSRCARTSSTS